MSGNLIWPILITCLAVTNGRSTTNHEHDGPSEAARSSKSSFDAQFHRGSCPDYFYQLGNECVYFSTAGKIHSWQQVQHLCATRIARLLQRPTSFVIGQTHLKPSKGVRPFVLNTPDKTRILEALYREHDEVNYAIRLPTDFGSLQPCADGKEDHWPQYCHNPHGPNVTCFESSELGSDRICLRPTECDQYNLRLACEFTLPGSTELTASTFRHCPKARSLHNRLSIWAWVLVAVGAMLLLLLLLGGVLALISNSSRGASPRKTPLPDPGARSAVEPMLVRATPVNVSDTDYLEPQPSKRAGPSTIAAAV